MSKAIFLRPLLKVLLLSMSFATFTLVALLLEPVSIQAQTCSGGYFCGVTQYVCAQCSDGFSCMAGDECWDGSLCNCSDQCYSNPAWYNTCSGNAATCTSPTCGGGTCVGDRNCYWYNPLDLPTPTPEPGNPTPLPAPANPHYRVIAQVYEDINGDGRRSGPAESIYNASLHLFEVTASISRGGSFTSNAMDRSDPDVLFTRGWLRTDFGDSSACNNVCFGGQTNFDSTSNICFCDASAVGIFGTAESMSQWQPFLTRNLSLPGSCGATVSVNVSVPLGYEVTGIRRFTNSGWTDPTTGPIYSGGIEAYNCNHTMRNVQTAVLLIGVRQTPLATIQGRFLYDADESGTHTSGDSRLQGSNHSCGSSNISLSTDPVILVQGGSPIYSIEYNTTPALARSSVNRCDRRPRRATPPLPFSSPGWQQASHSGRQKTALEEGHA